LKGERKMALKILRLGVTKEEATNLHFDDIEELLLNAEELDYADGPNQEVQLFSFMSGSKKPEYHGFIVGKTLVYADNIDHLVGLICGIQSLLTQLAEKSPLIALKIFMALKAKRDFADKPIDKSPKDPNIDKTLQMLFDLARKPKDPDA
jgi:hypothetical protein